MAVALGRRLADEDVQLGVPQAEPLHLHAEVRRVQDLGLQQLDIEPNGPVEVLRMDADVVTCRALCACPGFSTRTGSYARPLSFSRIESVDSMEGSRGFLTH